MSRLRDITESIARKLRESEYFRTSPQIPVVAEDSREIMSEIDRALKSGALVLINFESGEDVSSDSPGPAMDSCEFLVTVSEAPQLWRAAYRGAPSATAIAEATAQILHHWQPLDEDGAAIVPAVLIFQGMRQRPNDSFLQYELTFSCPVVLDAQSAPTR